MYRWEPGCESVQVRTLQSGARIRRKGMVGDPAGRSVLIASHGYRARRAHLRSERNRWMYLRFEISLNPSI